MTTKILAYHSISYTPHKTVMLACSASFFEERFLTSVKDKCETLLMTVLIRGETMVEFS